MKIFFFLSFLFFYFLSQRILSKILGFIFLFLFLYFLSVDDCYLSSFFFAKLIYSLHFMLKNYQYIYIQTVQKCWKFFKAFFLKLFMWGKTILNNFFFSKSVRLLFWFLIFSLVQCLLLFDLIFLSSIHFFSKAKY